MHAYAHYPIALLKALRELDHTQDRADISQ